MVRPLVYQTDGEQQQGFGSAVRRLSRPLVPAVPRSLEKKRARSSTGDQTSATNSITKHEMNDDPVEPAGHEGDDWATMVVEDQEQIESAKASVKREGQDHFEHGAKVVDNLNGDFEDLHITLPVSEKETEKHKAPIPLTNGGLTNGMASHFHPESTSPSHRYEPKIVFGSSSVSDQSSPIMPPSASSTAHTHSTPLSDAVSPYPRPVYQGYSHAAPHAEYLAKKASRPLPPCVAPEAHHTVHMPADVEPKLVPNTQRDPVFEPQRLLNPLAHADALHAYLVRQINDPMLADCVLDLLVRGEHARLFLHGVVVARSPTLRSLLMSSGARDASGKTTISLALDDSFVTVSAIMSAIRVCYGDRPTIAEINSVMASSTQREVGTVSIMESCLASISAGQTLQLDEVAISATRAACQVLNLSNVEIALDFGLPNPTKSRNSPSAYAPASPPIINGRSTYPPYSDQLMRHAMLVLLSNLPASFNLDTTAPPSRLLGGLPIIQEAPDIGHKRISSNPRLSLIQFGELSSPTDPQISLLSTILFSVPFEFLFHLLQMLARPALARAIVNEREKRRTRYMERASLGDYEIYPTDITSRANWEESIDESGLEIKRCWMG